MSLSTILGAVEIGLIFSIMSLGVFITFRILDFPDLTVDGSFTLGCVTGSVFAIGGHPILGILMATLAGAGAGFVTAFLHTKMRVNYILAGILTMTGLYSINLKVAGGTPNLSLFNQPSIFSDFKSFLESLGVTSGFAYENYKLILALMIVIILTIVLYLFFKTQTGMAIRATGDNEEMVRASSINTDAMKMCGLSIANALVGMSAAIFAQYQQFYDITLGIGMMVVGLTSIIVGESIFGKRNLLNSLISLILGAILYRILLSYALSLGMNPNDWKLLCSLLVIVIISIPVIKDANSTRRKRHARHK